ncbi:MAG: hypothetical protein IPJ82_08230 [Lewinellaceae bacterium]|nr:hypothetical protein [Lewinellaceae bacterium]
MKKAIFLSLVFALVSIANVWAQTEAQPTQTTKPTKDNTEKINHAEEKSGGSAFSGQGKGGDKDVVEKREKNKDKAKKKGKKAKKAKKEKKKAKKEKSAGAGKKKRHGHDDQSGDDDQKGQSTKPQPDPNSQKPTQRPQTGGVKNPKDTQPKPKTSGGNK